MSFLPGIGNKRGLALLRMFPSSNYPSLLTPYLVKINPLSGESGGWLLGSTLLTDVQQKAADFSGDSRVSTLDITLLRRNILNKSVPLPACPPVDGLGDVNGNGFVTVDDVNLVQGYILGQNTLNDIQLKAADVNKNNAVTTFDVSTIRRYLLGLSSLTSGSSLCGDVNGDKRVNGDDIQLIRDHVTFASNEVFSDPDTGITITAIGATSQEITFDVSFTTPACNLRAPMLVESSLYSPNAYSGDSGNAYALVYDVDSDSCGATEFRGRQILSSAGASTSKTLMPQVQEMLAIPFSVPSTAPLGEYSLQFEITNARNGAKTSFTKTVNVVARPLVISNAATASWTGVSTPRSGPVGTEVTLKGTGFDKARNIIVMQSLMRSSQLQLGRVSKFAQISVPSPDSTTLIFKIPSIFEDGTFLYADNNEYIIYVLNNEAPSDVGSNSYGDYLISQDVDGLFIVTKS